MGAAPVIARDPAVRVALISAGSAIILAAFALFGQIVLSRLDTIHELTNSNFSTQAAATEEANARLDASLTAAKEANERLDKALTEIIAQGSKIDALNTLVSEMRAPADGDDPVEVEVVNPGPVPVRETGPVP